MHIKQYVLGELLHLANSSPPWWRYEFYRIKDHILTLYGTWEGVHLQHIVKHCYDCEGSGKKRETIRMLGEVITLSTGKCTRCGGSGKFAEFWTVLKFYRLSDRHFHIPNGKYYTRSSVPDLQFDQEIEGYIQHESPGYYLHSEAAYWLALIFDRALFWQKFGHTGYRSRKFTPMVILSTWIFDVSRIPHDVRVTIDRWRDRWITFQRNRCEHEFPWSEEPSVWDECRKCGIERLYTEGYDGVPF